MTVSRIEKFARTSRAVKPGDLICYPAKPRSRRDYLRVTRIERAHIYAHREHPDEWERGVEFEIVPAQIADQGVFICERTAFRGAKKEARAATRASDAGSKPPHPIKEKESCDSE